MSDKTCTQAKMQVAFPLMDRRWWSQCLSLGLFDTSTSFFARRLKKATLNLQCTPVVSLPLVESGNCFGGHGIFGILHPQLLLPRNQSVWQCDCLKSFVFVLQIVVVAPIRFCFLRVG